MTRADDLRAAADHIAPTTEAGIRHRARLRETADAIERIEREMRIRYAVDRYYPARDWANDLRGDTTLAT
jgi:hypothetical protein